MAMHSAYIPLILHGEEFTFGTSNMFGQPGHKEWCPLQSFKGFVAGHSGG